MAWSSVIARWRTRSLISVLSKTGVVATWLPSVRGGGLGAALAGSNSRRPLDDLLAKGQQSQGQCRGMAASNHKHKKIIKMAKGYRGRSKSVFKIAIQKVEMALQQAYRDRKNKKRDFRRLWIERINAGVRQHGMSYSAFINQANKADIVLNRKVLADMAVTEPYSFRAVVETVKAKGSTAAAAEQDV